MITKQYINDMVKGDDENDHRNYTLVYGKKVPNHGHWEYLNEDGNVVSKGTFIDGYHEGAWQIFHDNGQLFNRGYFVKGERFPKVIDPEFPELGPLSKLEFFEKQYNHIDEIDDEELEETVKDYLAVKSLKIAMDKILDDFPGLVKPFFFFELYAFAIRASKPIEPKIRTHFTYEGMDYISDQLAEYAVRWIEILTGDLEDEYFKETISWINDIKKDEGSRKLYGG